MEILLFIVIALAVTAGIIYHFVQAAERRKALLAWAQAHGLRFDPAKDRGLRQRFPEFKCLHRGDSRYAYNVMSGEPAGQSVLAFDYHYGTGAGKSRQEHYFSAVIVASPFPLKPLLIRREGFFDKVKEFLGFDDIDFESAEFSRKFYVSSPDKRWAYDVIHQRMMEYLLAAPHFSIQFDAEHLIVWRDKRLSPIEFSAALDLVHGLLDRMPEYLVRQQQDLA